VKNLGRILTDRNLSQRKLALAIGAKPQSIGSYARGDTDPGLTTAAKIAAYLGVSIDELIDEDGGNSRKSEILRQVKLANFNVKIIDSTVHAGETIPADDGTFPQIIDHASLPFLPPGEYYGLKVIGDSMVDTIYPGDFVICSTSGEEFVNDQIYVVITRNGANVKRVRLIQDKDHEHYGKIALISDNPRVDTWYIDEDDLVCVYKVVHVLKIQDL